MDNIGLIDGDLCNRDGCKGIMLRIEDDSSCSCHISPPCSHCTDAIYVCGECEEQTEKPWVDKKNNWSSLWSPENMKTSLELFNELPDNEFGYTTIAGKYYWMEYKGKYPDGMTVAEILGNFNTCFGYKWISSPLEGVFHIKVYTD